MRRRLHGIKGVGLFLALGRLSRAAHAAETALERMREHGGTIRLRRRLDAVDGLIAALEPCGGAGPELFAGLNLLVRRLAHRLGKQAMLTIDGEPAMDRRLTHLLRGPLVHLVRNCCDHGIEPPAARVAAGKARCGHIAVDARSDGGGLAITVADDGAGLPLDRIGAAACARNITDAASLAGMTSQAVADLAFRAGLSTAPRVTMLSGRGIGLDLVRTTAERSGGSVAISSRPGVGTTVILRFPLMEPTAPARF